MKVERSDFHATPKKSLGQHFLHDKRVLARIADASGLGKISGVLEIGPGTGALTGFLAERAGKVLAVETDGRLIQGLKGRFPQESVIILHQDARQLDWPALQREYFNGNPFALCANLPYYITSPLIMAALEGGAQVDPIVVLVQKEVALRLAAKPKCKDYGLLSLAAQRYATVETLFEVAPGCFTPPPRVMSAVVRLKRRPDAPTQEASAQFFKVARAAFAMRRKTLANNLVKGLGMPREAAENALHQCGLNPAVRAEELTVEEFDTLTRIIIVNCELSIVNC
ncbi:MAG: 16S rRNA (adenine(1518)-N(6)/adenine(1519)-N(6))-dimethyltransferase RsmA [Clostridia bacterium]|nr:16S rRNA (adenine(1518)-N(6)/adenine(1519)-N(6))-dimethyltransferase RsmA [Clostridia bacterium]